MRLPRSSVSGSAPSRPALEYDRAVQIAPFVVCPETLGPLEPVEGGFWSPNAERLYPLRQGLIFMGFPARDAAMISSTMKEERDWQGTGASAAANTAFLHGSAPRAVELINVAQRYVPRRAEAPRALELGCGNGWVSWLLAEAGLEIWMCDFEANSLATGLNLEHPNLGEGKRFVTDARYAPFATGSFDLVLFKEFVHHVEDYRPLFREANRLLRDGGVMAMLEPVRSVWKTVYEMRHPDPHHGHHITWPDAYLRAIRGSGMDIVHQAPIYVPGANRRRITAWLKERAVTSVDEARPAGNWLAKLQLRLLGGASLLVIARKARRLPEIPRPAMVTIDPDTLIVDDEDFAEYSDFPAMLQAAARELVRRPGGDHLRAP